MNTENVPGEQRGQNSGHFSVLKSEKKHPRPPVMRYVSDETWDYVPSHQSQFGMYCTRRFKRNQFAHIVSENSWLSIQLKRRESLQEQMENLLLSCVFEAEVLQDN